MRRRVLDAAGGIAPVPIFEDLDLVQAIKGAGRLALLRACAHVPVSRQAGSGALRRILRDQTALAGYLLDLERDRIARWCRRHAA